MDATKERSLDSVDALFDALGGSAPAVAIALGAPQGSVEAWKRRGKLPSRLLLVHTGILSQRGLKADPSLWGMEGSERAA